MENYLLWLSIVKIIIALAGALYLVNEVYLGHKVEEAKANIERLMLMRDRLGMYKAGLYKQFYISLEMEAFDNDQYTVEADYQDLDDAGAKKLIDQTPSVRALWSETKQEELRKLQNSLKDLTGKKILKTRRQMLFFGMWLIIGSAILEVVGLVMEH